MGIKRKRDVEEEEEKEEEEVEDGTNEVPPPEKKTQEFSVSAFRKGLKGDNCFAVLKEFVRQNKSGEVDVALQFLNAGGGADDIIHILSSGRLNLPSQYAVVFQALHLIIMRTLTAVPGKQLETEQACNQLLSLQLHTVHSMLSEKGTAQHKKIVLRLLTAMVSLSVPLAQEILSHVTLSPAVVEALTHHSRPSDKLSVRTSFIHFLLAFLVEGNMATIRPLLDKKGLLVSIVPGLKQDSADVVVLVLTTLRSKVVENTHITKTNKLHIFNTQVMQSFLELYEWKGPAAWTPKAKRRHLDGSAFHDQANSDDKLMVAEAAHELLLELCTSQKYGVAFHDKSLGTGSTRHNQLIFTVLQHVEQPWEKRMIAQLVVQTVRACPDLLRSLLPSWESFLEPRASGSWLKAVNFIKEILVSLDPEEYLKPAVDGLGSPQLLGAVQTLTVPGMVLSRLGVSGLLHQFTSVRHEVVSLLVTMLDQLCKVSAALQTWNVLNTADFLKFKNGMSSYLTKHLPSGDVVYTAWQKEFSPATAADPETSDLLPRVAGSVRQTALLDLLLLYHKCCPHMVSHLEFKDMWKQVHGLGKDRSEENEEEEDVEARVQIKALQLLIGTDTSALSPNKDHFEEILLQLLTLARHSSLSVSKTAGETLVGLLQGTGLFDSSGDELSVWLHCYRAVPHESFLDVASFLTQVVTRTAQNLPHYNDITTQAKEEETDDSPSIQKSRMEDVFTDLMEDDLKETELIDSSVFTELSPLLACALEVSNVEPTEAVVHYLSCVVVHLLHSQVFPGPVIHLTCQWAHLPTPVAKYLRSWNTSNEPAPLKKPFGSSSPESRLSKALLQCDDSPSDWPQDDPVHDLLLFKLALFHVSQLASRGQLSEVTCNTTKIVFKQLFDTVQGSVTENFSVKCLKSALSHPVILQFFSPLYKKKHTEERLVTELAMELLNMASKALEKHGDVRNLFVPFRRKLLSSIAWISRHPGRAVRGSELVQSAAQLLHLRTSDIREIIGHLVKLPREALFSQEKGLSAWGLLLNDLLEKIVEPLPAEVVTSLVERIVELNGADSELAVHLHHYLTRFPHSMASISPESFKRMLPLPGGLAALLLERNPDFVPVFSSAVSNSPEELFGKPELFLPMLSAALCHGENETLMQATFEYYQDVLQGAVCKPHQAKGWLKEHLEIVNLLISKYMDGDTCKQLSKKVLKKYMKFSRCDPSLLSLMETVFKSSQSDDIELVMLDQLLKCLEDNENPSEVCQLLISCADSSSGFAKVKDSEVWGKLPPQMLLFGMANDGFPVLLTTLSMILRKIFIDSEKKTLQEAKFIFEMVLSHSEFLDIILGPGTEKKHGLVELLVVLAKSNSAVLLTKHVPVILGAYGASLSTTDQKLLKLLHLYESSSSGSLHQYRPYLWGEAAVSHYSIRSQAGLALWRVPKANQVLELLEQSVVNYTVRYFPDDRKLQTVDTMLADSPKVYDPAFLLPLFSHVLAPESVVYTHKVNHCGALAVTIRALSSNCPHLRAAAGHVLARYHDQLQAGRAGKEERLLLQFISAIRGGVSKLMEEEEEEEEEDKEKEQQGEKEDNNKTVIVPQLPGVVTTFLARASLIMSQPLHSLYGPLHEFILAKPALDLQTVPELLVLLRSDHVDFRLFRLWILEVIRDGFRNKDDIDVSFRHALFKLIMDLYSSVLADSDTRVLILQVLESALKLPGVTPQLVSNHGLVPWLHHCISNVARPASAQLVSAIISIVNSIQTSSGGAHSNLVISLLLLLLPVIPSSLREVDFCSYLKCVVASQSVSSMKECHLKALYELGKSILGSVEDCERLVEFGCQYAIVSKSEQNTASGLLKKITLLWLKR